MIDALRRDGDSIGARVNVVATGVPPGLGEPVFDRLDADLAHAMMSINAVKGVEIGAGFASVEQRGIAASRRDDAAGLPVEPRRRHAGRHLRRARTCSSAWRSSRPRASSSRAARSTSRGNRSRSSPPGRHDPCVGIRAVPIAEAMLALVLADHYLRHRAQNADVRSITPVISLTPRRSRSGTPAELWSMSGIRRPKGLQRRLQPRSCWVRAGPWAIVMFNWLSIREPNGPVAHGCDRATIRDRWETR